jgi:drug/metabolite transporter (DMT)-like permease
LAEAYAEELERHGSARDARQAVLARFGDAEELTTQLQAAVSRPEQLIASWLGHAEVLMSKWWMAIVAAVLVVCIAIFRDDPQFFVGALAMLGGVAFVRSCQISPWLRVNWPWFASAWAIATGPAVILPAAALVRKNGDWAQAAPPMVLGALIVLAGFAVFGWALFVRRTPSQQTVE